MLIHLNYMKWIIMLFLELPKFGWFVKAHPIVSRFVSTMIAHRGDDSSSCTVTATEYCPRGKLGLSPPQNTLRSFTDRDENVPHLTPTSGLDKCDYNSLFILIHLEIRNFEHVIVLNEIWNLIYIHSVIKLNAYYISGIFTPFVTIAL